MSRVLFYLWLCIYCVGMWNYSSRALFEELSIYFTFTTEVSWSSIWSVTYLERLPDDEWLLRSKISHVTGSFVLALLWFSYRSSRFWDVTLVIGITAAVEFVQEFFGRDTRFFDMLLNAAGVILALLLWRGIQLLIREKKEAQPKDG